MNFRINSTNYLDKLLRGLIWAPNDELTKLKWKTEKNVSKLEVYHKIKSLKIPENKELGYDENSLPSLEYLLRSLS